MAYIRGPQYLWRSTEHLHIWAEDGSDGWSDSVWAEARKPSPAPGSTSHDEPSGVGIRQEIADAYVVMRLAELVCEQRLRAVVESAVTDHGGNGGCQALQQLAGALVESLEPVGQGPVAQGIRRSWLEPRED